MTKCSEGKHNEDGKCVRNESISLSERNGFGSGRIVGLVLIGLSYLLWTFRPAYSGCEWYNLICYVTNFIKTPLILVSTAIIFIICAILLIVGVVKLIRG